MPWWRLFKRDDDQKTQEGADEQPRGQFAGSATGELDAATRERRRRRLQQRISNLRHDIRQAESALEEENRWSKRVAELDAAMAQAREDLVTVQEPPPGREPIELPPTPVEVQRVEPGPPSDVRFTIGGEAFRFSEEIDWSERGHQKSEFVLRRFAGDVETLIPDDIPADRRDELREHLGHSIGALAELLRENALEQNPQPELTLHDLATPCPKCHSWRDVRNRCISCQRREWRAQEIHAEIERLLDERNSQLEEIARWRDALPVLRRQLDNAQQEVEKYR